MSGSELSQFEGHLAELMWRADAKGELYTKFLDLLNTVHNLDGPCEFSYPTPLFDSWTMEVTDTPIDKWQIVHSATDAESESSAQSQSESENEVVEISSGSDIPPNWPVPRSSSMRMRDAMTEKMILSLFSSSSMSDDDAEKTLTEEPAGATAVPVATASSDQPTRTSCKRKDARKERSKVAEREEPSTSVSSASYLTAQSKSSRAHVGRRKATGQKTIESEGASARPQRMRSDKICHPMGYRQAKKRKNQNQ